MVSAGLDTSKSNVLQLLVTLTKITSYLISYFLKIVTSYNLLVAIQSNTFNFSSYYKLKLLHEHSNMLLLLQV